MDEHFSALADSTDGFKYDNDSFLAAFGQSENISDTFRTGGNPEDLNLMDFPSFPPDPDTSFGPTTSRSSYVDSPDDSDFSDNVLKFISSILMEENIEQKPSMFHDPLALLATERSLYDVLGEKYPASPNQPSLHLNLNAESRDDYLFGNSSAHSTNSITSGRNSFDSKWISNAGDHKPPGISYHSGYQSGKTLKNPSHSSFGSMDTSNDGVNGLVPTSTDHLVFNIFNDSQSILQFKRGMEEASKFLPRSYNLNIGLDSYTFRPDVKEGMQEVVSKMDSRGVLPVGSRGRKNHSREDSNLEGEERSSKQSAISWEEPELSDIFDRVLLFEEDVKGDHKCCNIAERVQQVEETKPPQKNGQVVESNGKKTRAKKQSNGNEVVDLRTLLISCAQSVAADDRRTANEQLKQIRHHSSLSGTGSQRLASIFADALEARLAGTGSQIYKALISRRISATEKLKAYQLYLSACPYKKVSIFFANKMIIDLVMNSTKQKLHIIDFGILYGFQWPILIKYLSGLSGGAPELRITGIELPLPGFRPAELVEETGRRLAKYCEQFNVRFQYHAIAQKWETINTEDLNINSDEEVLAVNCLFQFKNLLDETVVVDNPRDAVLKLIRNLNPDIFIQSEVNGSYSAPFFVTRFREALYHYSSLFDLFDTNISREDKERANFEKEFIGREVMNAIACEGSERVERPETYKQWQVRLMKNGFRILPLNQKLINKLRGMVKEGYHNDFVVDDDDGSWLLQGWKGRVYCASSCWVPAA